MFAKVCCRDKIVTCCSWTRDVEKALEILEVGGVHSTLCQIRRETQQADAIQVCGLIGYQLCGPVVHEHGLKSQQIARRLMPFRSEIFLAINSVNLSHLRMADVYIQG